MTKTAKLSIEEAYLRKLVTQELQKLHEEVDHEGVKDVVSCASKMLKAISVFNDTANEPMKESLLPHLEMVVTLLEGMIETPGGYIPRQRPDPKTIKLRRVEDK